MRQVGQLLFFQRGKNMNPQIVFICRLGKWGECGNMALHIFFRILCIRDLVQLLKRAVVDACGCRTQLFCDLLLCLGVDRVAEQLASLRIASGGILCNPPSVGTLINCPAASFAFFLFSCHSNRSLLSGTCCFG